jgi:hypothetical protein
MRAVDVLSMHGDADCDRREYEHGNADVPVGDTESKDHRQDDEADAPNAAGRVCSLADSAVWLARVCRNASPETSWQAVAEIETHATFWRSRSGRFARCPALPTMWRCQNGLRLRRR